MNVKKPSPLKARRILARAPLAGAACAALLLGGCAATESLFGNDRLDYRSQAGKTAPLEVPPELSQLARDGRYRPQSGVVTASGTSAAATAAATPAPAGAAATAGTAAPATVALSAANGMRVERQGNQRWLVTGLTPEQLWPQLQSFWVERGFTVEIQDAKVGVMETNWAENRAKLPQDLLRRTLGRVLESLYSTGEMDKFRTRLERTPAGTEIYISHRGMEEVLVGTSNERTVWRPRAGDPQLEAEFLARLMTKLGSKDDAARATLAAAPQAPERARPAPAPAGAAGGASTIDLDDNFDRAWRRVGLALDRSGFTVEDRDRAAGLYFVRYVAPGQGADDSNFFTRLFSGTQAPTGPTRLRVAVKAAGDNKSTVSVQNAQGGTESGEAAQRIVGLLVNDLR